MARILTLELGRVLDYITAKFWQSKSLLLLYRLLKRSSDTSFAMIPFI